jgi:hypothetical protein
MDTEWWPNNWLWILVGVVAAIFLPGNLFRRRPKAAHEDSPPPKPKKETAVANLVQRWQQAVTDLEQDLNDGHGDGELSVKETNLMQALDYIAWLKESLATAASIRAGTDTSPWAAELERRLTNLENFPPWVSGLERRVKDLETGLAATNDKLQGMTPSS